MGFFNEIKKVLFGAKAVTKSAAEKATEYGKEKGADFIDSADDFLDSTKETADELCEMLKGERQVQRPKTFVDGIFGLPTFEMSGIV